MKNLLVNGLYIGVVTHLSLTLILTSDIQVLEWYIHLNGWLMLMVNRDGIIVSGLVS